MKAQDETRDPLTDGIALSRSHQSNRARGLSLLILLVFSLFSIAHSQGGNPPVEPAPGPAIDPDAENLELLDDKPVFLLPDIVVEGEDKSRLIGGVRILDLDIPSVTPRQQPLVVGPSPSHYNRRLSIPFELELTDKAASRRQHAFLHTSIAQHSAYTLSTAWLLGPERKTLLWGHANSWQDRQPDYEHISGNCGWMTIPDPDNPNRKIGFNAALISNERTIGDKTNSAPAGEFSLLSAQLHLSREVMIQSWPGVVGFEVTGGKTVLESSQPSTTGSWLGFTTTIVNRGSRDNLLKSKVSGSEIDLQVGLITESFTDLDDQLAVRWRGHLGHDFVISQNRIGFGFGGGGNSDVTALGPFLMLENYSSDSGIQFRILITPQVIFPQDYITRSLSDTDEYQTQGIDEKLDLTELAAPALARINPFQHPQIAWPNMQFELNRSRGTGSFRLTGEIGQLQDPYAWVEIGGAAFPGMYELETLKKDRIVSVVTLQHQQMLSQGLTLSLSYKWSYDEEANSAEAIPFRAEHQARASLEAKSGNFLFGSAMDYFGKATMLCSVSPPNVTRRDQYSHLSAFLGWNYRKGNLFLIAENLLNENTGRYPGSGDESTRGRLVWEMHL